MKEAIYHHPVQAKANNPVAEPAKAIQIILCFNFVASNDSKNSQVISTGKNTA